MKILLLKSIKGIGQAGDIKNVSDGYARNFLIPNGFGKPATIDSQKQAETLKKRRELDLVKSTEDAKLIAEKVKDIVLEIKMDANEEGSLYGSVDAKQIARELKAKHGIVIEQENIKIPEHLKKVGEYQIDLKLYSDQTTLTTLMVRVLPS